MTEMRGYTTRSRFSDPDLRRDIDWRDEAACREHDADLWFSTSKRDERRAITICNRCPVMATCHSWARDTNQHFGVWGGAQLTEQDPRRA